LFLELVFEALFEYALAVIFDVLDRAFAAFFESIEIKNSILAVTGYTLLGAAAGALSLFIIPHPLFRPSQFHGISLLASPILTGLGMWQLGLSLRTKARPVLQIDSFWNGFAFALGVALIRFYFAKINIQLHGEDSAHLSFPVLSYNSTLTFKECNILSAKVFTWKQQ